MFHQMKNIGAVVGLVFLLSAPTLKADPLTTTQLHATMGIVTNFILSDESKNFKPPKKTGQVNSYATNGLQVFDGSLKDDGFYQKGVTPNYSRNDSDEIVTDHITGLQWQDDAEAITTLKSWLTTVNNVAPHTDTSGDTATTYCSSLTLGGYTDWRLPKIKELLSLSYYEQTSPAMDSTFQNTAPTFYWSSTPDASDSSRARYLSFNYGTQNTRFKIDSLYVRCVREGDLVSPVDFSKNGNIVTDNITGLQWQDDTIGTPLNWQMAIDHCEASNLDGFSDWRLPNLNELSSLIDYSSSNPAMDPTFQNITSNVYWSSTSNASYQDNAFGFSSTQGGHVVDSKSNSYYVRCVREGQ